MSLIIFLQLFFNVAFADELAINYKNFNSKIFYSEKEISYKDLNSDLSLKNELCSSVIFHELKRELNAKTKSLISSSVTEGELVVKVDGISYKLLFNSKDGVYFYHFIDRMKASKIEAMLNCK